VGDRSKRDSQKCDDGSIGRRYRPIPQYHSDISAKSVAYSFARTESKVSPAPPFNTFQSCRNARIGSIRDARRAGAKAATSDTENNRKAVPPTVNASVLPSPYSITRMTRTGWLICGPLNRFSHSAAHMVSPRSQQTHAERFALNQNMLRLPRFLVRLDKGHRLRRRLAKQEALHLVSPQTLNQIELRNGFHSLGNHFHS
jgi:hypothetical protein